MVVVEQPTEAFRFHDQPRVRPCPLVGKRDHVANPLVVPLGMVMSHVFPDHMAQGLLPEEDERVEAFRVAELTSGSPLSDQLTATFAVYWPDERRSGAELG